jgi:hypothetical protein
VFIVPGFNTKELVSETIADCTSAFDRAEGIVIFVGGHGVLIKTTAPVGPVEPVGPVKIPDGPVYPVDPV